MKPKPTPKKTHRLSTDRHERLDQLEALETDDWAADVTEREQRQQAIARRPSGHDLEVQKLLNKQS